MKKPLLTKAFIVVLAASLLLPSTAFSQEALKAMEEAFQPEEYAAAREQLVSRLPFKGRNKATWTKLEATPEWREAWTKLNKLNMAKLKAPPSVSPIVDRREHRQSRSEVLDAASAIDKIISTKLQSENRTFNALTSDEQFVRRLYVQAAGRIPTHDEAVDFLRDNGRSKRHDLVDDLLIRTDYRMQMFNWLTDMLRVKDVGRPTGNTTGYQAWLIEQLATNRPWDEIVRQLLVAEGSILENPAGGWLLRDSGMPLDSLSNTMTTFMGANIGCAQCHDHPLEDWTQREFFELAAFFGASDIAVRTGGPYAPSRPGKTTVAPSMSVIAPAREKFLTFPEDYAYDDAKAGDAVPPAFPVYAHLLKEKKFSDPSEWRQIFASWMTHEGNGQFAATIANRLWKKAFGRGVIEPVTEMDTIDYAVNPDLMRYLAGLVRELEFDLMAFQRVIYHTKAFQSQVSTTPSGGKKFQFEGPVMRRMTAEQAWDSMATLAVGERVNDAQRPRKETIAAFDIFEPGTLEVMVGSSMESRFHHELFEAAAEVRETHEAAAMQKIEADFRFARASEMSIPGSEAHFLRMFGQSNKELADDGALEGGVPQILMLMNGKADDFFSKRTAYFHQKSAEQNSEAGQLDSLYLSFLARKPTAREKAIIKEANLNVSEIAWILLNTREFMFVQ